MPDAVKSSDINLTTREWQNPILYFTNKYETDDCFSNSSEYFITKFDEYLESTILTYKQYHERGKCYRGMCCCGNTQTLSPDKRRACVKILLSYKYADVSDVRNINKFPNLINCEMIFVDNAYIEQKVTSTGCTFENYNNNREKNDFTLTDRLVVAWASKPQKDNMKLALVSDKLDMHSFTKDSDTDYHISTACESAEELKMDKYKTIALQYLKHVAHLLDIGEDINISAHYLDRHKFEIFDFLQENIDFVPHEDLKNPSDNVVCSKLQFLHHCNKHCLDVQQYSKDHYKHCDLMDTNLLLPGTAWRSTSTRARENSQTMYVWEGPILKGVFTLTRSWNYSEHAVSGMHSPETPTLSPDADGKKENGIQDTNFAKLQKLFFHDNSQYMVDIQQLLHRFKCYKDRDIVQKIITTENKKKATFPLDSMIQLMIGIGMYTHEGEICKTISDFLSNKIENFLSVTEIHEPGCPMTTEMAMLLAWKYYRESNAVPNTAIVDYFCRIQTYMTEQTQRITDRCIKPKGNSCEWGDNLKVYNVITEGWKELGNIFNALVVACDVSNHFVPVTLATICNEFGGDTNNKQASILLNFMHKYHATSQNPDPSIFFMMHPKQIEQFTFSLLASCTIRDFTIIHGKSPNQSTGIGYLLPNELVFKSNIKLSNKEPLLVVSDVVSLDSSGDAPKQIVLVRDLSDKIVKCVQTYAKRIYSLKTSKQAKHAYNTMVVQSIPSIDYEATPQLISGTSGPTPSTKKVEVNCDNSIMDMYGACFGVIDNDPSFELAHIQHPIINSLKCLYSDIPEQNTTDQDIMEYYSGRAGNKSPEFKTWIQKQTNDNQDRIQKHISGYLRTNYLARIKSLGYYEHDVNGDGNCQYSSVADNVYRSESDFQRVKDQAIQEIEDNEDVYIHFLCENERTVATNNWKRHIEIMRDPIKIYWGNQLTLAAISNAMHTQLNIISDLGASYDHKFNSGQNEKNLIVIGHWGFPVERHYTSLRPIETV